MQKQILIFLSFIKANPRQPLLANFKNAWAKTGLVLEHERKQVEELRGQGQGQVFWQWARKEAGRGAGRVAGARVDEQQARQAMGSAVGMLVLYRRTVEGIVEGRREVMANPELRL